MRTIQKNRPVWSETTQWLWCRISSPMTLLVPCDLVWRCCICQSVPFDQPLRHGHAKKECTWIGVLAMWFGSGLYGIYASRNATVGLSHLHNVLRRGSTFGIKYRCISITSSIGNWKRYQPPPTTRFIPPRAVLQGFGFCPSQSPLMKSQAACCYLVWHRSKFNQHHTRNDAVIVSHTYHILLSHIHEYTVHVIWIWCIRIHHIIAFQSGCRLFVGTISVGAGFI